MRPDNETKIVIIVNDQRELQILHSRLIELSDELRLSRKIIKSVYGHYEVCFDNTISILILLKEYKYVEGWYCDYFAISTFDIDYFKKWQRQLSPHGKELTSFNEIRDKIKELCLKEKNKMRDNYKIPSNTLPKEYTLSSAISAYVDTDITATLNAYQIYQASKNAINSVYGLKERRAKSMYAIKNVIFNDPATIVFWADGTKTVVKAQGDDTFDPEKGLAMAISKKALGNKGNYCNELKKWLPEKKILKEPKEIVIHNTGGTTNEWSEKVKKLLGIHEPSCDEILDITNLNRKPEND